MDDMVAIPGGRFRMGSDRHYPEEAPAHEVIVDGFLIDIAPVTNRRFAAFIASTGYRTLAERAPDAAAYPGARPEMLRAGSLVFRQPDQRVATTDPYRWWEFAFGADWAHPLGPNSSVGLLKDHPVVHIAYEDARAYAEWAGKALPTEAEWEFAARGGLDAAEFSWGDSLEPDGRQMANIWRGEFPWQKDVRTRYARTSPVGSFPPNGYGLVDMIGNVWEWTTDWFTSAHASPSPSACCVPRNPRAENEAASRDPATPDIAISRRVLKGGSHLCAPNYCRRYRPAARYAQPIDTSTSHVGFRCIRR